MSQKIRYARDERCPVCGSKKEASGIAYPIGGRAFRNSECSHCGAMWEERYDLADVKITRNPYEAHGVTVHDGYNDVYVVFNLHDVLKWTPGKDRVDEMLINTAWRHLFDSIKAQCDKEESEILFEGSVGTTQTVTVRFTK